MTTSTETQPTAEQQDLKASPDWLKRQNGANDHVYRQSATESDVVELKYRSVDSVATSKLAKGLGLFSIALGAAEILGSAQIGELIGADRRFRAFLPVLGAREIAHGIGILSSVKPTTAVWTRVGGDAIDLAYLGAAFAGKDTNKKRLAGALLAILGVGVLDVLLAKKLSSQKWSEKDGNPMAPTTVGQPSARAAAATA
ncbi:MAG: hypothetical protein DMF62_16455 [Acidobacteria bacterium]|nr:MAG: hypothetical protein DMF62_16455 [Acidobacteriota bacterium]